MKSISSAWVRCSRWPCLSSPGYKESGFPHCLHLLCLAWDEVSALLLMPRPQPTTSSQKAQPHQFQWDPLVTITCRNAITELIPEFTLSFSHLQLILFGRCGWAELCWRDKQSFSWTWLLLAMVAGKECLRKSSWLSHTSPGCVEKAADHGGTFHISTWSRVKVHRTQFL